MQYVALVLFAFVLLASPAETLAQAEFRAGQRVRVQWHGQWFDASVLEVGTGAQAGTYKIRYDGYDSSWDEYVGPERIWREPETERAPEKPRPAETGTPVGRYVCQSYNGQTQQLETRDEFVLERNGTYRSLLFGQAGRWSLAEEPGALAFTGILDNGARAAFLPEKRRGTIVFDWGGDVRLDCYRQSR